MRNYILEGKRPVACNDLLQWATWLGSADRRVALNEYGDVCVSTVFLGIDYGWYKSRPMLFETKVFGGKYDRKIGRYSTWREAEIGHTKMCKKVFSSVL